MYVVTTYTEAVYTCVIMSNIISLFVLKGCHEEHTAAYTDAHQLTLIKRSLPLIGYTKQLIFGAQFYNLTWCICTSSAIETSCI